MINKSEVQFLVDHDSYLVYHKVRLSDAIEIVLYRRHIYPEKRKARAHSLTLQWSRRRS